MTSSASSPSRVPPPPTQLLAMPILILMARLCPPGAEGTTYALVTSVQMVGGTVGGILSQIATQQFGVTNLDFHRLWQLSLLTAAGMLLWEMPPSNSIVAPSFLRSACSSACAARAGDR